MHEWQHQAHVTWECKFHVVFIPKYRQKVFYGKMRIKIGQILRELCRQRNVELCSGVQDGVEQREKLQLHAVH